MIEKHFQALKQVASSFLICFVVLCNRNIIHGPSTTFVWQLINPHQNIQAKKGRHFCPVGGKLLISVHKYRCLNDNIQKIITKKRSKKFLGAKSMTRAGVGIKGFYFYMTKIIFPFNKTLKMITFLTRFRFEFQFYWRLCRVCRVHLQKIQGSLLRRPTKFLQRIFKSLPSPGLLPSSWRLHFPPR